MYLNNFDHIVMYRNMKISDKTIVDTLPIVYSNCIY